MSCCNSSCNHDPCGSSFNQLFTKAAQYAQYTQSQAVAAKESEVAAEAAQAAAEAAAAQVEGFESLYLGAKDVPPALDNEGNPLQEGALYFNTVIQKMYVWDGTNWITAANVTGFDEATNFLSTGSTEPRNLQDRFADVVNVLNFGADPTGAVDSTLAIQAAIDYAGTSGGGRVFIPKGDYLCESPLVVSHPNVMIQGENSSVYLTNAPTTLKFSNTIGPCIRTKKERFVLRDIAIVGTGSRPNSTPITKDNYASLSLTRDDQNYAIWCEANDVSGSDQILYFTLLENCSIHNQPNTAIVFSGETYQSKISDVAIKNTNMHGIVVTNGDYTNRTNKITAGVLEIVNCEVNDALGHGLVVGSPLTGLSVVRCLVRNCDFNAVALDASKLLTPHTCWFVADNSVIEYSGFNAGSHLNLTNGALFVSGKNIDIKNNRFISMGNTPINIDQNYGRTAEGIVIDGFTLPSLDQDGNPVFVANVVEVAPSQKEISVSVRNLQGSFSNLASNATETNKAGLRYFKDGFNIERNDQPPFIINRTNSSGAITYKRLDGVSHGIDHVGAAYADSISPFETIYNLPTRSGNMIIVTGSYNDSGTIRRFADLIFFMWGFAPNVVSSETENSPATRSYAGIDGALKLSVSSGVYQIRVSGTGTTFDL